MDTEKRPIADLDPTFAALPPASAGLLAFAGFGASIGVAFVSGGRPDEAILRGLGCMIGCYAIGWLIGFAARVACREHMAIMTRDRPIPEIPEIRIPEPSGTPARGGRR